MMPCKQQARRVLQATVFLWHKINICSENRKMKKKSDKSKPFFASVNFFYYKYYNLFLLYFSMWRMRFKMLTQK